MGFQPKKKLAESLQKVKWSVLMQLLSLPRLDAKMDFQLLQNISSGFVFFLMLWIFFMVFFFHSSLTAVKNESEIWPRLVCVHLISDVTTEITLQMWLGSTRSIWIGCWCIVLPLSSHLSMSGQEYGEAVKQQLCLLTHYIFNPMQRVSAALHWCLPLKWAPVSCYWTISPLQDDGFFHQSPCDDSD